jgi:transcriptional regulator with XRE-family HTH domain
MTSQLGNCVRLERQKAGLSRQQLAGIIGYKNLNKGARRIEQIELEGSFDKAIFREIAEALNLDHAEIENRIQIDHENFEAFLDEPVAMRMIVRLMPAVYVSNPLPDEIKTHEEATVYARGYAKSQHVKVCLILSRRITYWFDASGKGFMAETTQDSSMNSPSMKVSGRGKIFLLSISESGRSGCRALCGSLTNWGVL